MRVFDTVADYVAEKGKEIGVSDWVTIDQDRVNLFADATGDHQWIHIDPERTKKELGMGTIAHGYLTMSLVAGMPVFKITNVSNLINYGANRLRFTNMVPVNSRVRLRTKLAAADDMKGGGVRMTCEQTMEIEGQDRPAMIAETLMIAYP